MATDTVPAVASKATLPLVVIFLSLQIGACRFESAESRVRKHTTEFLLVDVSTGAREYIDTVGMPPSSYTDLEFLTVNPGVSNWAGPYIQKEELRDTWGTTLRCVLVGSNLMIKSAGPDRTFDTADDMQVSTEARPKRSNRVEGKR